MSLTGADLFGQLPLSGGDAPVYDAVDVPQLSFSRRQCLASNQELLSSLQEGLHSEALHQVTLDDAAQGWMSYPVLVEEVDLETVCPLGTVPCVQ
jgi:hypothetical protein